MDTVKTPPAAASRYPTMPGTVPPGGRAGRRDQPGRCTPARSAKFCWCTASSPNSSSRSVWTASSPTHQGRRDDGWARLLSRPASPPTARLPRRSPMPRAWSWWTSGASPPDRTSCGYCPGRWPSASASWCWSGPVAGSGSPPPTPPTSLPSMTSGSTPESQIRQTLSRAWSLSEDSTDVTTLFQSIDDERPEMPTEAALTEDAPIVKLVDTIFADAMRAGASDVHVEPQARALRIRYRVDGLLRDVMEIPRSAAASITSRIKITAGLDISERRRPQDGRTRLTAAGRTSDARVSTLPGVHGEKVVVRLLPTSDNMPALASVGLDAAQLEALRTTLDTPQGLVLITGPTGSGKTNTL